MERSGWGNIQMTWLQKSITNLLQEKRKGCFAVIIHLVLGDMERRRAASLGYWSVGMEACREERRLKVPPSLFYYFVNSRQRERLCRRTDAEAGEALPTHNPHELWACSACRSGHFGLLWWAWLRMHYMWRLVTPFWHCAGILWRFLFLQHTVICRHICVYINMGKWL